MSSDERALVVENARIKYAFWLAIVGLALSALLVAFLVLGAQMKASADIAGVVGIFTSLTGTLVGAFFGAQIGAAGKEQERADRRRAEKMLQMALPEVPEPTRQTIMQEMQK